ncbi:MAG: hypothetical protein J0L84_12475, partial [Verrucomicrobia bacterium]|nr:hypothetical protein [Verrucomicrobiota bacterium]
MRPAPHGPEPDALPLQDDRSRLPALLLVDPARGFDTVHRLLPLSILAVLLLAAFMPWQQSVSGTGRVIAYDPLERRVNV